MMPAGMTRTVGAFSSVEYFYKGVRIQRGVGRFCSPYDFYIGEHTPSNRVLASTLAEAAAAIDKKVG